MKKKVKSLLSFAEHLPCGSISITFHTWQDRSQDQVLRKLARCGVKFDGPPHSTERAVWLQGEIGPVEVTVFLPLDQDKEQEQQAAA